MWVVEEKRETGWTWDSEWTDRGDAVDRCDDIEGRVVDSATGSVQQQWTRGRWYLRCAGCGMLVEPEADATGCGMHCPECDATV